MLSIEEYSAYVGKKPGTVRNEIAQGTIPDPFCKEGRKVLFDKRIVDRRLDRLPKYTGALNNPDSRPERRTKR